MAEINETTVERRARQLAKLEGKTWDLDFAPMNQGAKIELNTVLDDGGRDEYRARARAELLKEAGDA